MRLHGETETVRLNGDNHLVAPSCARATLGSSSLPEFVPLSLGPPTPSVEVGRGGKSHAAAN